MTKIPFLGKKTVAVGTVEFDFEKPAKFNYTAGQYLIWTFPDLSPTADEKGNVRDFTMSSAPFENRLSFTTRMRDTAFKNYANKMRVGQEIEIDGPYGDLVLPKDRSKKVVMIAGGIGITPFRSMLVQATYDKSLQEIFLFHADKTPADAAYLENMQKLEKENPNLKVVPLMTKPEKSWIGEAGYLTPKLLKKYLQLQLNSYLYMAAGPPKVVDAIRETLSQSKIQPENVLGENFGGY